MRWLAWAVRGLGILTLIALIVGAVFVLRGLVAIAIYEQSEDPKHLAAKYDYLHLVHSISQRQPLERPNIVLILFDDLGHGDLGAFGAEAIATPHLDSLALSGLKLENYYSPSSVCSPARAGLMTGRYPPRAGLSTVTFPEGHLISNLMKNSGTNIRLPGEEILLPEILFEIGYRTGMVGKWHMGDRAPSLPNSMGFESFFGALYSNDMEPFALYRNDAIAHEAPSDQTLMNERYTRAAIEFLESTGDEPFFLYYATNFPHIPLFSAQSSEGRSKAGLYGDVVEDLDDSVGAILETLERSGRLEDTLVIVTSDNGPWYEGSPGAVRGRKNQSWEGGMRVPFIAHWPSRIEAGRSDARPVSGVDLLPTLLGLIGLPSPFDRKIDGIDIQGILLDGLPGADPDPLANRPLFYFTGDTLDAVRAGRFKYHRRRGVRSSDIGDLFSFKTAWGPWLFDLALDPAESYDSTRHYPEDAERLGAIFDAKRQEMEDNPRGWL